MSSPRGPAPRLLTLGLGVLLLVGAAVVSFRWLHSDALLRLGAGRDDATMTLLGWAPVGGLLVVAGLLALGRDLPGGRSTTATVLAVALLAALVGFAYPYLPARGGFFEAWRTDIDRGGPAFARAATWTSVGVALTLLWFIVLLGLVRRSPGRWLTEQRFYALGLAPPSLLVLVGLLVL